MRITEYRVRGPVPRPLRFAFVSDLHDYPNPPVLEAVKAIRPDAVLVGGDFVHSPNTYARGFAFLEAAAAIAPTFCSIGNHERHYESAHELSGPVARTGAVLLDDSAVDFGGIRIGGLSSGCREGNAHSRLQPAPAPDLDWLAAFAREEGFKLLLCHHPEYYVPYVRPLPIGLTLSGHAHGGQWRLFGQGVFAPGQGLFPRYTSGSHDGGRLIVGRGIGNKCPAPRLNNPPEVLDLRLEPEDRAAPGRAEKTESKPERK